MTAGPPSVSPYLPPGSYRSRGTNNGNGNGIRLVPAAPSAPPHTDQDAPALLDGQHEERESIAKPKFEFFTDTELASLAPLAWLIYDVLYCDTLAVLLGKYGSYKTFILLEMAFCIALGADFHGRRVKQGAVLYIYAEGRHGIPRRMAALRAVYGNFTGTVPIYFLPRSVVVTDSTEVMCLLACLKVAGISIAAVFIDTVARNMDGDENKVADMNQFIRGCDLIRQATGATVIAAHHTGWEAERSRGSTSLPGALDTEMFVARDGDSVTVKCTKQKDATPFAPFTLEAFPVAGSLAFRTVVPRDPKLTPNERAALTEVQTEPGLKPKAWEEASGLPKGSHANARNRLLSLAYVKRNGEHYVATDAGRLALGTKYNSGTTDVQMGAS